MNASDVVTTRTPGEPVAQEQSPRLALQIEIIELDDPYGDSPENVVFYRSTCTTCSTS